MLDVIYRVFGDFARLLGHAHGAKFFVAQHDVYGYGRSVKRLCVGVAQREAHVVYALSVHVVYGIAATTAHADDLDDVDLLGILKDRQGAVGYIVVFIHDSHA